MDLIVAGVLYAVLLLDAATIAWRASRGRNALIDKRAYNTRAVLLGLGRIHYPILLVAGIGWLFWRTDPSILEALVSAGATMLHVLIPAVLVCLVFPSSWLRALCILGACIWGMAVAQRYDVTIVVGFLMCALLNFEAEMLSAFPFESETHA